MEFAKQEPVFVGSPRGDIASKSLEYAANRPAVSIDHTSWEWLPVYSYSRKTRMWYGKIPGTAYGTTTAVVFAEREACIAWLKQEYRALYGIKETTPVVLRYEPPMTRRKLVAEEVEAYVAQALAGVPVAQRRVHLSRQELADLGATMPRGRRVQFVELPGLLRSLDQEAKDALHNILQELEEKRARRSVDNELEAQRASHGEPADGYDGQRTPEELGGPWPEHDGPLATMYVTTLGDAEPTGVFSFADVARLPRPVLQTILPRCPWLPLVRALAHAAGSAEALPATVTQVLAALAPEDAAAVRNILATRPPVSFEAAMAAGHQIVAIVRAMAEAQEIILPPQEGATRTLYAAWVWQPRPNGGRPYPYAHWAFPTLAAAEAFCRGLGARWIVRMDNREIQQADRRSPLPIYLPPEVQDSARALAG